MYIYIYIRAIDREKMKAVGSRIKTEGIFINIYYYFLLIIIFPKKRRS